MCEKKKEDYDNWYFHFTGIFSTFISITLVLFAFTMITIIRLLGDAPDMFCSLVGFFVVGFMFTLAAIFVAFKFFIYVFEEHANMFKGRRNYLRKKYKKHYCRRVD